MSLTERLLDAITARDIETVRRQLAAGADPNAPGQYAMTPLIMAAKANAPDIIRLLVKYKADIHFTETRGRNALHYAAMHNHAEAVTCLMELGASWHMDENGMTPSHIAAASGATEALIALVKSGYPADTTNLHGETALHIAAMGGHFKMVRTLLGLKQPVDQKCRRHMTPIHFAAVGDHPEIIRLLAEHGAQVNTQSLSGDTPLHLALKNDSPKAVRALILLGADIFMSHHIIQSPFQLAQEKLAKNPGHKAAKALISCLSQNHAARVKRAYQNNKIRKRRGPQP